MRSSHFPKFLCSLLFVLIGLNSQVYAASSGLTEGALTPTSEVRFQLIDGFAFQNYIKVYVENLHVGNYIGPIGTSAESYKKLIDKLENKARINGGHFYFDLKDRKTHGEATIEKIVHFPKNKSIDEANYDLASCQQELRDLENRASMIFQESLRVTEPLEELIHHMRERRPTQVMESPSL